MSENFHTLEEISDLEVRIGAPKRIPPGYSTDNFFAIATTEGEGDLVKQARESFTKIRDLPDLVYIPEKHTLQVGNSTVHYAVVCGIYSR